MKREKTRRVVEEVGGYKLLRQESVEKSATSKGDLARKANLARRLSRRGRLRVKVIEL